MKIIWSLITGASALAVQLYTIFKPEQLIGGLWLVIVLLWITILLKSYDK